MLQKRAIIYAVPNYYLLIFLKLYDKKRKATPLSQQKSTNSLNNWIFFL